MFPKFYVRRFIKRLENIQCGHLTVVLPDQTKLEFKGAETGTSADIHIKSWAVVQDILRRGDIGFAESYADGKWDTENLCDLLTFAMENRAVLEPYFKASAVQKFLQRLLYMFRRNSLEGSRRNILAHYDLGNDFYKLWLDPTMTYSSALYSDVDANLSDAQFEKYRRIYDRLGNKNGSILEIGCGWGGFADHVLKENKDIQFKGITLSDQQYLYARKRLGETAEIQIEDYRKTKGLFDHIVSIEMFEAVGEEYWPVYFKKIKSLLKDTGNAIIQTITISDQHFDTYKNDSDFIRSYIFPGGLLPSVDKFKNAAHNAKLKVVDIYEFGQDYARTLKIWLSRFDDAHQDVKNLGFDDRFIKLWRFYLASCAAAFQTGYTNVCQIELRHE